MASNSLKDNMNLKEWLKFHHDEVLDTSDVLKAEIGLVNNKVEKYKESLGNEVKPDTVRISKIVVTAYIDAIGKAIKNLQTLSLTMGNDLRERFNLPDDWLNNTSMYGSEIQGSTSSKNHVEREVDVKPVKAVLVKQENISTIPIPKENKLDVKKPVLVKEKTVSTSSRKRKRYISEIKEEKNTNTNTMALVVYGDITPPTEAELVEEVICLLKTELQKDKPIDYAPAVKEFLTGITTDPDAIEIFLRGRKYDAKAACKALLWFALVKYDKYSNLVCGVFAHKPASLQSSNILGILKYPDNEGRKVLLFNASAWDPDKYSLDDITVLGWHLLRMVYNTKKSLEDGYIFVQQCDNVGFKIAQQYKVAAVRKLVEVFWHACPMQVRAIHFINAPVICSLLYKSIKRILPKDLSEIIHVSSSCDAVKLNLLFHKDMRYDRLPECLGGNAKMNEVFERYAI